MKFFVSPRTAKHETDFLSSFAGSMLSIGHRLVGSAEKADLSLVWGWDPLIEYQRTIYVEAGWLPRWKYQVSPVGINAESNLHETVDLPIKYYEAKRAAEYIWKLRALSPPSRVFEYSDPRGLPADLLPDNFILVPLQVEGDRNLRNCRIQTMQGLINRVTEWDPPYPVIFRGHPARIACHDGLVIHRKCDELDLRPYTVHQFLKAYNCRGVVCLNSNVAHDALIWNRAVVALEKGPWPEWICPSQLPLNWDNFESYERAKDDLRSRYIFHVMEFQWDIGDASNLEKVEEIIGQCTAR